MATSWLFAGVLALLMVLVAFATYRSGQLLREGWLPPVNLMLSPADNVMRLGLIAICFGIGYAWGPGPQALGWSTATLGRDLSWGAGAGLFISGLIIGVERIFERYRLTDIYNDRVIRSILPARCAEWPGVLAALLPADCPLQMSV
ncbi:MAG: hypothetical protein N2439_15500, partial [Anaerolineae bacterium]|nr:hypothetical protein [Anaerolineae bacterium]